MELPDDDPWQDPTHDPWSQLGRSAFPCWRTSSDPTFCYHAQTRLGQNREGLLLDIGAVEPLSGERWDKRVAALAMEAGKQSQQVTMKEPVAVQGVGGRADLCTIAVKLPIATPRGQQGTFTTPLIPDSEVPGLFG